MLRVVIPICVCCEHVTHHRLQRYLDIIQMDYIFMYRLSSTLDVLARPQQHFSFSRDDRSVGGEGLSVKLRC